MTVYEITVKEMPVDEMTGQNDCIWNCYRWNDCRSNNYIKWL